VDANHFAGYIRSTTESSARLSKKKHPHLIAGLEDGVVYRVAWLISALLNTEESAIPVLHTLVWFKATVLRLDFRSTDRIDLKTLCPRVDAAITQLLEHTIWAPKLHEIHCAIPLDVLPDDYEFATYYDCASARRQLWHAWLDYDCANINAHRRNAVEIVDEEGRAAGPCFHGHNRRLLELLNLRAAAEIKRNVLYAVGNRLPAELAELVFEFAMVAEEIPQDHRVVTDGIDATVTHCHCIVVAG
jgi:hypothetical protein